MNLFPANEHTIDRAVRVVGGLGLMSLLAVGPVPGWGLVGLLGIVFVVTGAIGSCPLYTMVGFSTKGHDGAGTPSA